MEEGKKSADAVEKEGEKVTGGTDATENKKAGTSGEKEGGEEYIPGTPTKKEDSTGYNELPEQSKVGGG
ncbi:hypothetical protein ACFS7Z_11765 [Pontibacter toksunensis]|uniref:Uncharacterized protein n=1 Tax=Pontibacter toksunensis TaxID=1332631 RepID=A0ABW6BVY8_9BACT